MAGETATGREADRFSELIGVEYLGFAGDEARARVPVQDDLRQVHGIVHGGVMSTLAEDVCSRATHEVMREQGMSAFAQAIETSFLRPISEGHVNASARVRHRGRTTWIWDVEMTDEDGRLCALSRMTVAVRPARS